jgi:general secretion pathway protein L
MSARLLIHFQPALWPKVEWAISNTAGIITLGPQQNKLEEIPTPQNGEIVTILVPGADVLMTQVKLPYSSRAQLRKAAPYALEEQLIADIETQHFALGNLYPHESVAVAVVAKEQLQEWIVALHLADIKPEIMLPDYLAIPYEESAWTILVTPDTALIRTDKEMGYAIEPEHLKLFLRSLTKKAKTELPERLVIRNATTTTVPDLLELNIPLQQQPLAESFLATAATVLNQPIAIINLLQNEFHTDHKFSSLKKRWQTVAILAVSWLFILFTGHCISYFYLKHKQQSLQTQLTTLYQQVLPYPTALQSRTRVEEELIQLKKIDTHPSFINLVAKTGEILKSSPNIHITAMDYESLALTLQIKTDPKTLTQLNHRFVEQGLVVKNDKTNNPATGMKVTLQMGEKK